MPDIYGVLTEQERQKVDSWYRDKWVHKRCSICSSEDWILADHVVMPAIYTEMGIYTTGKMNYPQILISCRKCGLTLYFNAVTVGIIGGK